MTILVTGYRGTIARRVAADLRAAGQDVRTATRGPVDADTEGEGAVVAFDPLDGDAWHPALDGVDKVFLYAAPDAVDTLVPVARAVGVKHAVLLSSMAAGIEDVLAGPLSAPFVAAEQALRASPMTWTFVRPGGFATNTRWWAPSIRDAGIARIPYPDAHTVLLHEQDIVDVAVAALTRPGHEDTIHTMTGPESLSQRRQVEVIAEALGRPIEVQGLSRAQAKEDLPFLPDELLDALARYGDRPIPIGPTLHDILGASPRTFTQWAQDHVTDFR